MSGSKQRAATPAGDAGGSGRTRPSGPGGLQDAGRSLFDDTDEESGARADSSRPQRRRASATAAAGDARASKRTKVDSQAKEQQELLDKFGGRCFWCWKLDPGHFPLKCSEMRRPDMSDYEATRKQTRGSGRHVRLRGRQQAARPVAEQEAFRREREQARTARRRALEREAQQRLTAHLAVVGKPLTGWCAFGHFSDHQIHAIEFARGLELVRKAQLPVARADLKLGRVFYCWQSGMHTKFFPVQLIEDVPSRMQVRAPCVSRRTPPPSPRPIFFSPAAAPSTPTPLGRAAHQVRDAAAGGRRDRHVRGRPRHARHHRRREEGLREDGAHLPRARARAAPSAELAALARDRELRNSLQSSWYTLDTEVHDI